jgi:hypothetical protein
MTYSKNIILLILVTGLLLPLSFTAWAQDEILSLEGARIRGNQELPNVLYLIPWKPPKIYSLEAPENNIAANRPLKLLERSSFQRLVNYHQAFKKQQPILKTD